MLMKKRGLTKKENPLKAFLEGKKLTQRDVDFQRIQMQFFKYFIYLSKFKILYQ